MRRTRSLWCVLVLNEATGTPRLPWVLNSFGNGRDFQYPIFPTQAEARRFTRDFPRNRRRKIVPCTVTYPSPGFGGRP